MSKNKDISKFLSASIRSGILDSAITNNDVPSGIDVFDTLDSLPLSGLVKGQEAFVEENSRIYVSNGSGWYNVGTNIQISPTWLIEPDATYTVADSATPLIITAKAQDSDTPNVVNQSFVSDSAQYMVTISNDSSVWTFTPKSTTQIATSVDAGELTDSNGDFIYTFKWSDGINVLSKAVTITYNSNPAIFTWGGDRGVFFGASRAQASLSNNYSLPPGIGYRGFWSREPITEVFSIPNGSMASQGSITYGYGGIPACSNGEAILHGGGFQAGNGQNPDGNFAYVQKYNPVTNSSAGSFAAFRVFTSNYTNTVPASTVAGASGHDSSSASDGTRAFFSGGGRTYGGVTHTGIEMFVFDTAATSVSWGQLTGGKTRNTGYNNHVYAWMQGDKYNMQSQGNAVSDTNLGGQGQYQDTASGLSMAMHASSTGFGSTSQGVMAINMDTNTTAGFVGNLTYGGKEGGASNATDNNRVVFGGGRTSGWTVASQLEYFVFSTFGNATYMTDMGEDRYNMAGSSGNSS